MKTVEWKPELYIGVEKIDDDHQHLIDLINYLIVSIEQEYSQEEILSVFNELERYVRDHFEREEQFMDTHCTSDDMKSQVEKHKKQHAYFSDKLSLFKTHFQSGSDTSTSVYYEIVEFLLQWLLDHIINEDLKLAQCIKKSTEEKQTFLQRIGHYLRKKTSLHQRLWLILSLPLLFFMIQTFFISYNGYKKYNQFQDVENITHAIININNVITQLQKERGLSNAYITSGYKNLKKELYTQRIKTDQTIQKSITYHKVLTPYIDIGSGLSAFQKLDRIRNAVNQHTLTQKESMAYYSHFINTLINLIKKISYLPINSIGRNTYGPILILLHMNEIHALSRNEGLSCLTTDSQACEKLKALHETKQNYLDTFKLLAAPELTKRITEIETSENTNHIHLLQSKIIDGSLHGNSIAKEWFTLNTNRIEAYKKTVETVLQHISHNAYLRKEHFSLIISIILTIIVIIILFISISIYLFKESILHPLEVLTNALHKLSSGEKKIFFSDINKKDAIGKMEHAYNHLRRSLIKADYTHILMEFQSLKTKKYAKLSNEDSLTGIANHRAFMQTLKERIAQAKKYHTPLTLLILDLDRFKKINDTYGHATGDLILQHFVQHTKTYIRTKDIFARIGGEEFALLLPDTPKEKAYLLAETIVSEIASLDLEHLAPGLKITVSIGVSEYRDGMDPNEFIAIADKHLYQAKHKGRNQVCCKT